MFCNPEHILRKARGFTLVEVMVAITILLLVILPLATLFVRSLTVIQNAALYSQAIQLAQERMELCQVVDYSDLYYYNKVYSPGFPYAESPLPATHMRDGDGVQMNDIVGNAYDSRDIPETTDVVETYFDPTDYQNRHYPVPIYRDYYNNHTGQLLDPNFNGLCDDDLDGDGESGIYGDSGWDFDDIEIATNGRGVLYSDPMYDGTKAQAEFGDLPVPGDGLWDTIVEGSYVSSMDPMYRWVRVEESPSPILDLSLLMDRAHRASATDYRFREATYRNFVRMTTFLDPTPDLACPNISETWVDPFWLYYVNEDDANYSLWHILKIHLCRQRDMILGPGITNSDLGVLDQVLLNDGRVPDPFTVNYSPPVYGMKIIVNVFYLTGEGEMELRDLDGDSFLEETPMELYGGARRVRLERNFYNENLLDGDLKVLPSARWFLPSDASGNVSNPSRSITIPFIGGDEGESDPCDNDNWALPYLDPDYLSGQWN